MTIIAVSASVITAKPWSNILITNTELEFLAAHVYL